METESHRDAPRELSIAYTPDSDDAFTYHAWENGQVGLDDSGIRPVFHRKHIAELNRAAEAGLHDVTAVSSVVYPSLASRYAILSVGTSVGRGWGPVVVSRDRETLDSLRGRTVGVGGIPSTGWALARMYAPGAELVELAYDTIADRVADGTLAAGVMIHEELLYYSEKGLHRVVDLGRAWTEDTGGPLPVGLNLIRRELDPNLARDVATTIERSVLWAFSHREEALSAASRFGRGLAQRHVAMFSNRDTLRIPADVRGSMRVLFDRVADAGMGPRLASIDVVEGETDVSAGEPGNGGIPSGTDD